MNDTVTLDEACFFKTGKLDSNEATPDGQYPFFTCAEQPLKIDHYAFDESVVLVAGNNAAGNFHVSRYTGKFNAYQRTYILTAKTGHSLSYIYYSLKLLLKLLKEHAQGSQTKFLTIGILKSLQLRRLDFDAQNRIASVLSALDAKIELNNQINAELEGVAKLLHDYWFVQYDFPMSAAQAASLGRPELAGHPYRSSGGKLVPNETLNRPIPEGWSADTLDKLGEVVGGTTPSKENDAYYCTAGIPWITPKDLSNNKGNKFIDRGEIDVTEAGQKNSSLKIMPAGSVLLSSRAPIGYTAIASNPLTTNQGFKSFVPNKGYSSDFIYQTLNHYMKLIEQNASGSTFKEISGGTLKAIKIPLPQPSLAKLYSEKVASMSAQQQNLEKQNQELTQLRDWLLPMLMNGQVTVQ